MATLAEIGGYKSGRQDLKRRFVGALIKASWDVFNEAVETENHTNRLATAKAILLDPEPIGEKYFILMMSNATLQTSQDSSSDNDIQFVVNGFFNTIANEEAA